MLDSAGVVFDVEVAWDPDELTAPSLLSFVPRFLPALLSFRVGAGDEALDLVFLRFAPSEWR